jgi:hypothetical protein
VKLVDVVALKLAPVTFKFSSVDAASISMFPLPNFGPVELSVGVPLDVKVFVRVVFSSTSREAPSNRSNSPTEPNEASFIATVGLLPVRVKAPEEGDTAIAVPATPKKDI